MYSTGTVTTTANSTKLVGVGTKWLNNINRVSAEQAIQVQIGTTVHNNSIQSIQSDTELTLNFPLPTAATGAKYVILTTMVHSVSDAMNKIVSMNGANVQFSDILTRWMTEQGIITVTLPDQTTQQLRTTKEMDKQLDGKVDKKGGTLTGGLVLPSVTVLRDGVNNRLNLYPSVTDGDDSLAFFQYNTIGGSWGGKLEIPRPSPGSIAKLMQVGDYGVGGNGLFNSVDLCAFIAASTNAIRDELGVPGLGAGFQSVYNNQRRAQLWIDTGGRLYSRFSMKSGADKETTFRQYLGVGEYGLGANRPTLLRDSELKGEVMTQFFRQGGGTDQNTFGSWGCGLVIPYDATRSYGLYSKGSGRDLMHYSSIDNVITSNTIYSTANTTKDSNGNLKAASPIVKLFADHIETNDESDGVVLEKLGTGRYKLKGALGMHSDASWGGIHGGIVIPDGINRLPLIWGDFEVLEDGDIIIESRFRDHQLPPPLKAKRLETYPEFKGLNDYDLCDIPNGHWVDVRVNMPSNSIYNQKQAEAERLAKIDIQATIRHINNPNIHRSYR